MRIVERVHRTIRDKLYKYFTYKNVLPNFVNAYNDTIHSTTGMAPSKVTDNNILAIWKRLQQIEQRIRRTQAKFRVGHHVRIRKEKMIFAKGSEQNYSTEIFEIIKVIPKIPRPVYELEDLKQTPIEGQFYPEELTPVRISKPTTYQIDKIVDRRLRRGILEYLVKWRGYSQDFNSWVPTSSAKNI
jgi:hypothetical protein